MVTKRDLSKLVIPEELEGFFDYALPEEWINKMCNTYDQLEYHDLTSNFVWLYDDYAKTFGRPFPLTDNGKDILKSIGITFKKPKIIG